MLEKWCGISYFWGYIWHMAGRWARCQAFHGSMLRPIRWKPWVIGNKKFLAGRNERQRRVELQIPQSFWNTGAPWRVVEAVQSTVSECDTRTEYLSVCVIAIRFLESAIAFLINYATQMCVCILGKPNYGTGTVIDSGFCSFLGCERWHKMTNFASWLSELSIPSSLPLAPFPEVQVGDILCLGSLTGPAWATIISKGVGSKRNWWILVDTKEGRNTWICEDLPFVCARVARASRRYVFPICTYVQWYPTIHLSNYPSTHPWPSKPAKWKPRMVCWNFPPLSSIWFPIFGPPFGSRVPSFGVLHLFASIVSIEKSGHHENSEGLLTSGGPLDCETWD